MRYLILFMLPALIQAQDVPAALVANPDFDRTIRDYLDFSVPVISCNDLEGMKNEVLILDSRTRPEYDVSHIPGAHFIGFDAFDEALLADVPKEKKIVVYCSIGYRSEKVGERIQAMGYEVSNLYGSIFEWVNQGKQIVDNTGHKTHELHTYNRKWSKWVEADSVQKTW